MSIFTVVGNFFKLHVSMFQPRTQGLFSVHVLVSIVNSAGETPKDVARRFGRLACVNLLGGDTGAFSINFSYDSTGLSRQLGRQSWGVFLGGHSVSFVSCKLRMYRVFVCFISVTKFIQLKYKYEIICIHFSSILYSFNVISSIYKICNMYRT